MREREVKNNDGPKNTISLDEIRAELGEPVDGMTYERYQEIDQLYRDGQLESVSEDELTEYREFKATMSALMESLYTSATKRILSSFQSPSFPFGRRERMTPESRSGKRPDAEQADPKASKASDDSSELVATAEASDAIQDLLEDIVGQMTEQNVQHAKNADYLKLMADTLIETKAARESADRRADVQAATNKRFTILALVLAFAAVVVPFVVESIKGWQ